MLVFTTSGHYLKGAFHALHKDKDCSDRPCSPHHLGTPFRLLLGLGLLRPRRRMARRWRLARGTLPLIGSGEAMKQLITAAVLVLSIAGCADGGSYEYGSEASREGASIGACIAEMGGDCRGAAVLDHYSKTGDIGVD